MALPSRDGPADPWRRMVTNPVMYTHLLGSYKKRNECPIFKKKEYSILSATVLGIPLLVSNSLIWIPWKRWFLLVYI